MVLVHQDQSLRCLDGPWENYENMFFEKLRSLNINNNENENK